MTITQFLKELAKVPRGWYFGQDGEIRYLGRKSGKEYCPLTFMYMMKRKNAIGMGAFLRAGDYLGLSREKTIRIVKAADNVFRETSRKLSLRGKLLKALGLTKKDGD